MALTSNNNGNNSGNKRNSSNDGDAECKAQQVTHAIQSVSLGYLATFTG